MESRPVLSVFDYNHLKAFLLDPRVVSNCDKLVDSAVYIHHRQSPHSPGSIYYAAGLIKSLKNKKAYYDGVAAPASELRGHPHYTGAVKLCNSLYGTFDTEQKTMLQVIQALEWYDSRLDIVHAAEGMEQEELFREATRDAFDCLEFINTAVLNQPGNMYAIGSLFSYPINVKLAKESIENEHELSDLGKLALQSLLPPDGV